MNKTLKSSLIAAGILIAMAAPAQAAVTIGSNLATSSFDNMPGCNISCTAVNLDLAGANQASGGLISPVNGTVVSWRVKGNAGNNLALRILRQTTGTTYRGVGTSAPASFAGPGTSPSFPASLPIQVGDYVGLNSPNGNLILGQNPSATLAFWNLPVLGDGVERAADGTGSGATGREVLVQAVVEPSNTLTFGKAVKNKKKGSTRLTVNVPNAGQLRIAGAGVKVAGGANRTVAAAGSVTLTIKAKGKQAKKLKEKGKVKLSPSFTFTPDQGASKTQTQKVKLARPRVP